MSGLFAGVVFLALSFVGVVDRLLSRSKFHRALSGFWLSLRKLFRAVVVVLFRATAALSNRNKPCLGAALPRILENRCRRLRFRFFPQPQKIFLDLWLACGYVAFVIYGSQA